MEEAQALQLDALEKWKRILGMDHPNTILAAASLANTYYCQALWVDAEKLLIQVVEYRRRVLGIEHPHTILAKASLDRALWAQKTRWQKIRFFFALLFCCGGSEGLVPNSA